MDSSKDIAALSDLSKVDLFARLGGELTATDIGGASEDRPAQIAQGKAWFRSRKTNLQKAICPEVNRFSAKVRTDTVALVAAIADLIVSICAGVSPITVAALCVKYGLDRLCEEGS
ncbi:hypothetical protein [uncultured Roseibium sp.]|uniref:hypothetical protein n=1 Tax=uncultured Roseibium sp. TaxID=1936171 RepID=UPI00261F7576|nr:hypothetical protein [uncultured Roseibium sp.]